MLLFGHHPGVGGEKCESVESRWEYVIIRFSRLRFLDHLLCLVETLQGENVAGEVFVQSHFIRCNTDALPCDVRGFFILAQFGEYYAQIVIRGDFSWVARNCLLIRLGRFIQFPSDRGIITGCDLLSFPFAGMFP